MARFAMSIIGTVALQRTFSQLEEAAIKGAKEGLDKATKNINERAKSQTPVNTGALMESGKSHEAEVMGDKIRGMVSFGDSTPGTRGRPNEEYAVAVHETHQTLNKFLEKALVQYSDEFVKDAAVNIRREISKVG